MRRPRPASSRHLIAAARFCAAAVLPLLASCDDASAPPGPPYLAIVTNLYTVGNASAPDTLTYEIRDLGTGDVRRRVHAGPSDTVIISVAPAAYEVAVEGLPTRCLIADGAARPIVLTDQTITGVIRYSIQCRGVISVGVVTSGANADIGYVFLARRSDGEQFTGLVDATDTTTIDDAGPGDYEVRLGGVASNCVIVSPGERVQHVTVGETGGVIVSFRVNCSDLAHRPQLLSLVSGFDLGASIFSFRVWDPDADLDGYSWDLTDCEGTSVLPDQRKRIRRGLTSGRGQLSDTLTVVGGYEVALAPRDVIGRCTEIRVFDVHGNSSEIMTHRIGTATGFAPSVRFFNSVLEGQARINSLLLASDPEDDIVGHFIMIQLRDGTFGEPNGIPDLGTMDPAGYLGLDVPSIPLTGRIRWDDVLVVIAYVIDSKGNAVRAQDADIFR